MKASDKRINHASSRKSHHPSGISAPAPADDTVVRRLGNRGIQHLLRTRPLQPKLAVSHPQDPYEKEADRVADEVLRMPESLVGLQRAPAPRIQRLGPGSEEELTRQALDQQQELLRVKGDSDNTPEVGKEVETAIQSLPGRGTPLPDPVRSFMDPRFNADFSAVRIHTDTAAQDLARSVDAQAFTVGRDVVFGAGHYAPGTERGKHLLAHELVHVVQQSSGPLQAGAHMPAAHLSRVSPPMVQRDVPAARDRLQELERHRVAGTVVPERDQRAAEHEALSASQTALDVAHDASGSEIANVQTRILDQISVIESARARGYIRAITELNAAGLDSSADYTSFGIAMGGNLLWALSGIVPMLPAAAFTIRGLGPFFARVCASRDAWTATLGVVGAMTAQFSAGLPSGTSTTGVKSAMITRLSTANSGICNHQRRRFYILLTDAIANAAPAASTDAQTYAAELEVGLSHALYGDIYAKGLNNGDLVDASKVEQDARDQLLRQYVAGSSAIDTHIIGSNDIGVSRPASDANVVDEAIALLGGQSALRFAPYELVTNQVRTAAQDLGITLRNFDVASMSRILSGGGDAFIPATRWDPGMIFGGSPTRWMNPLHTSSIVECEPRITNEPYMQRRHIRAVDGVTLRTSQMTSMVDSGGTRIWSMDMVWFQVQGGPDDTSGFIQVTGIPATFFIKYQIQD